MSVDMSIREIEIKTVKVAWENEEKRAPIILLSQKHRRLVGTYPGQCVCVWKTDAPFKKAIAVVFKQYKADVEGATMNSTLGDLLGAKANDMVMVGNVVIGGPNEPKANRTEAEPDAGQAGSGDQPTVQP